MSVLVRLVINAAALWVATQIVPGVTFSGDWRLLFAVALVFGVLNVAVKPLLFLLTLPFMLITLGLFTLVLNAIMLWLTGRLSATLGLGFQVRDFIAAFFGAVVVSLVSLGLSMFVSQSKPVKHPAPKR